MTATLTSQPTRLSPLVLLALLAGPLLSMVDGNVVNVAVPDIIRELHTTLASVQWVVSGYLLALAATLPATSWLAKRFGTTRVYAVSLAAFTVASLACSIAVNVPELIAFRVVQGMAAAPLVPLAMNLIFGTGTDRDRFPVSAGLVLFLGPALGPTGRGEPAGHVLHAAGDGARLGAGRFPRHDRDRGRRGGGGAVVRARVTSSI
jgi:MFS family permease